MLPHQELPEATFHMRIRDESVGGPNPYRWQEQTTNDLFGGRRVVIFALPGAFTPTCSSTHLPRYDELYREFMGAGVEEVFCLSVNDAFVMNQWGRHLDVQNVKLVPDGSGSFTRKMGMLVDKDNLGFGLRSWRYALVANDLEIEKLFAESGYSDNCATDPFEVSDADTVLAYLKGQSKTAEKPARAEFVG